MLASAEKAPENVRKATAGDAQAFQSRNIVCKLGRHSNKDFSRKLLKADRTVNHRMSTLFAFLRGLDQ